jgi:hypothetical protein
MNLELSKEQFRVLQDLVYSGNWVINANRETDLIKKYDEMESYIFSKCADFGFKELCEKFGDRYGPTVAFDESGIMDFVDEYNEETVFQEMAEELAYRDAPGGLGQEELNDYIDARYDRYMKEFEENGFENVSIDLD